MDFENAKSVVFQQKPVFSTILQNYGSLSLFDYFKRTTNSSVLVTNSRRDELLGVVYDLVQQLLGIDVAKNVRDDLKKQYYVSTTDHHGPLTHPFFVNSNIVQSIVNSEFGLASTVVLACSSISFNNSSFPRGFLWHDSCLKEQRMHFISWKYRQHSVYNFSGYVNSQIIDHMLGEIQNSNLKLIYQERLIEFITKVGLSANILSKSLYTDQMTIFNHALWEHIFYSFKHHLIYLSQEAVAVKLLIQYHLTQPTILNKLLFDESALTIFEKYFDGITGAFSTTEDKGTVLWWGLHKGQRIALRRVGHILMSKDGTYNIELTPDSIINALTHNELMPSMALTFIVIVCYYGLRCGGGFSQVNYLTDIKRAYQDFLHDIGEKNEQSLIAVDTTFLAGEFILALLQGGEQKVPATSIDLLLYGNNDLKDQLKSLSHTITLSSAVEYMIPELYRIITGQMPSVSYPSFNHAACVYV